MQVQHRSIEYFAAQQHNHAAQKVICNYSVIAFDLNSISVFFRVLRGFLWLSCGDLKKIRIPVKIHIISVLLVSHEDFLRWHWLANLSHLHLLDVC